MKLFTFLCATLIVTAVLGCGNRTPEQVVESYLKAKDWQERLKYVLDADKVKAAMEKRYSKYEPPEKYKVHPLKQIKDQWVGVDAVIWGKNALGGEVSDTYHYYLQKTNNGYKIDWESSVGLNSMTAAAFKAQRPKEPVKFRLLGKLSDYYSPVGNDVAETHWSVGLTGGDKEFIAYGYITKNSEDGKKLYEILKDGETHRLILTVRYPTDFEIEELKNYGSRGGIRFFSGTGDATLIEKLVCEGWLDK